MNRCQLQYLHPQLLTWTDCSRPLKKADRPVLVDGVKRHVCEEHRDQVRIIKQVGKAAKLRWVENPGPTHRPSRVTPGQLDLLDPEPAA